MTVDVETEVKDPVIVDETEIDFDNEDDDPMLVEMRAAEKEIEALKAGKDHENAENQQNQDKPEDKDQEPSGKKPVMIPIERLNAVLAERDALRDIVSHQKGVIEVQTQAISVGKQPEKQGDDQGNGGKAQVEPDVKQIISEAENKKIELAQKYEDGEMSYSEMVRETTKLDGQIREHELSLYSKAEENAKKAATDAISANNAQQIIVQEASKIQNEHPYIAEIDKLPERIKAGIWDEITQEAVKTLMGQGINPMDGSVQSRLALIKEKAVLTDKYGPQFTGKTLSKNQSSGQASEKAQQRAAKLDLAESQPPRLGANVGGDTRDLTEEDLMSMDEDQIADYLSKAPELVHKAAGLRKR